MTSPLTPQGEKVKKALQLLSDLIEQQPDKSVNTLLEKVVIQYDLSPKESEALFNAFKTNNNS